MLDLIVLCFSAAFFAVPASLAMAQTQSPASASSSPAVVPEATPPALKIRSAPAWQDLTPLQQLSLQPLAASWDTLRDVQKRKWISIARNYPALTPAEQSKLHSRMTEWASLSQQQRAQARLNFAKSKQLAQTQKEATWQAYQALSSDERKKLATSARSKPVGATAAKAISSQKLTVIPVTKPQTAQASSHIPFASYAVNRHTLLPHLQSPTEPTPASTRKN